MVIVMSCLSRPIEEMPAFVLVALRKNNLEDAYSARPPYQRNDYLRWIGRAKREATKQKRLCQMLSELQAGNLYMGMTYNSKGRDNLL